MKKLIYSEHEFNRLKNGLHITTVNAPRKFIDFKVFNEVNTEEFIWCRVTQIGGIGWDKPKVSVVKS